MLLFLAIRTLEDRFWSGVIYDHEEGSVKKSFNQLVRIQ